MRTRFLTAALATLLVGPAAHAIDPDGGRYLPDPHAMFWFVQISDTHVGADIGYGTQDTDHLAWVVNDAVEVIAPDFVVLTGDIVDGTNGLFVPTGQYQAEWDEYRGVVDEAGMSVDFFHDVVGNHDTYSDEGATYYLDNSLVGSSYGTWHEAWTHETDFGDYVFVGLCSADLTGSFPGLDSPGFTEDELAFLDESLAAHADADLAFVFSHHPLGSLDFGADEAVDLLEQHGVSLWSNGHLHSHEIDTINDTVQFNLSTAGKGTDDNLAVVVIDHDGVSMKAADIGGWPYVQITAPVDGALADANPHAYPVAVAEADAFVRAVVFDEDPDVMTWFALDTSALEPMEEVAPSVWQASFDATALEVGTHQLAVEAESISGWDTHVIQFEVRVTACSDGVDNDGDGAVDYPDDDGCWGLSDDLEAEPPPDGDDDDDSAGDDDDSAGDDDDATDDDDLAPDDDDSAPGLGDDDDSGPPEDNGSGCSCADDTASSGALALLLLLPLGALRRRGQAAPHDCEAAES